MDSGSRPDASSAAKRQEFREELAKMEGRLEAEKSETWSYPARRTYREYAARQALYALDNFKHRLEDYELSLRPVDAEPMPHVSAANRQELERSLEEARRGEFVTLVPTAADVLREHYIIETRCDHDAKRDKVFCNCSMVDLGWHSSIGDAVAAWVSHVIDELVAHGH